MNIYFDEVNPLNFFKLYKQNLYNSTQIYEKKLIHITKIDKKFIKI